MNPMKAPDRIGAPCWDLAYAESMISPIARIGDSHADWFLATHSPITCTTPADGDLPQQAIFERLFNSAGEEFVAVVKGGPGAGKSQLINWLKLRFDEALRDDLQPAHRKGTLRTVMIKRRSGSLKDALQQLVEQLPGYENYLTDIGAAISVLSGEQANRGLCFALSQALLAARDQEPPPHKRWKHLFELFQDVATVEHMARSSSVVSACIAHLTTGAQNVEGAPLPGFTADEFDIPNAIRRRSAVNGDLLDYFDDDRANREAAAAEVNRHLRAAIANLTGLRGNTLHEVFRNIRKNLRSANECLAFFVEDVSTLSILDEELVNAVEPQNDPNLCEMLSVLGMTIPAFTRLPPNLVDRLNLVIEIKGEKTGRSELTEPNYADQFVARYLNAVRAGPQQLKSLVAGLRQSGEVTDSACDDCHLQKACFAAFGSVALGRAHVGLFPFSLGATTRLLGGLDTRAKATPRSLLQKILEPLLRSASDQFNRNGLTIGLDVDPRTPLDLTAKQSALLGGWSNHEQARLSYLNWYWTGADTLDQGAGQLKAMLPWFGLRPFSGVVETAPPVMIPKPTPSESLRTDMPISQAYIESIQRLAVWYQQKGVLEQDNEYREYLLDVIKNSVKAEFYRFPSADQRSRTGLNTKNIEIEGMRTRQATKKGATFQFWRDQETYSLLSTLTDYYRKGNKTWNFEGAESQKRQYSKWLRRNHDRLVQSYAFEKADPRQAHRIAVRFLVMAYRFSEKKELPSDTAGSVQLLMRFRPKAVEQLSATGQALASTLVDWVDRARNFLIAGINVPQGASSSIMFIDPSVVIETLSEDSQPLNLPAVDETWESGHFSTISRLCKSAWSDLSAFLEEEAAALAARVESLRLVLRHWGIAGEAWDADVREYCESARLVVKALEETNHSGGNLELQKKIAGLTLGEIQKQTGAIIEAERIVEKDRRAVMTFDTSLFVRQASFMEEVNALMTQHDESLRRSGETIRTAVELDVERLRAQKLLQQLAVVAAGGAA
ncbi:MAG: hypothetical protein QE272_12185 [Nevskia sp.]|nr:hypothetical protein [Nevskia sp.]